MLNKNTFFFLYAFLFYGALCAFPTGLAQKYPFRKVVIWGHKLHSHSHSYIHASFFKAFKHLGYDTYWFDNRDDVRHVDFSNSLFITEGQVDQNMPLRNDCRYILHNCISPKYKQLRDMGNCLTLQVYDNNVPTKADKIDDYMYWNRSEKVLYMPWATDLLPHEIDQVKHNMSQIRKEPFSYYIGTVSDGSFGNRNKLMPFAQACKENNIAFKYAEGYMSNPVSMEENIRLLQTSIIAAAIQGQWQCEVGYIPCRIFKNISYGLLGITNSKTVYELFNKKIVYNEDTYQLFYDAKKRMETWTQAEQFKLMDFVKEKHTYLNRIELLLECLNTLKPIA